MKEPIKTLPKGIVYTLDMACVISCLLISQIFRYNFDFEGALKSWQLIVISAFIINSILFYFFKTYHGIVRYTTVVDSFKFIAINIIATVVYVGIKIFLEQYGLYKYDNKIGYLSWVSIFVNFFIVSFVLIGYRTIVRHLYEVFFSRVINNKDHTKIVIYDASEYGVAAKRMLSNNAYIDMQVVAFLDDDPNKKNKIVEGIPIRATDEQTISKLKSEEVQSILVTKERASNETLNRLVDLALKYGIRVQQVPPINKWLQGKMVAEQIKNINIEDLLEREAINIQNDNVYKEISGKKILVTGAAGSIGSEIVRQLMRYKPALVIMCDKEESALHELQTELEDEYNSTKGIKAFIGDICDQVRMEQLFEVYNPEVIYHAAAYKHVPLMEANPSVAIINNVLGTKIIAELAVAYQSEKFVMVSTDKAVNPTNVMGASKRIAEIFIQSYYKHLTQNTVDSIVPSETKFITTRFGNVLGSNGSVIPRFKKQIEKGGPITITHPEITRYFMTIPEACQLVIEAGVMGNGGEIFVFDMGKPVKIVDLANKMIQLSGKIPDIDIKLVFTGLRPGEKLYEELLNNAENTMPTYHEKILIALVREYDFAAINKKIESLISLAHKHYVTETVVLMKEIVPEFISNNSAFEKLDGKSKK